MLACLALSALFYPHKVRAALGIDEVVTQVINQVTADDHVARTLQNAISYESPDWNKALEPQLVRREEQIRVENERRAQEAKAQAEAEAARKAAEAANVAVKPAPVVQPSGDKVAWMTQAGIPQHLWVYVDAIVTRESGWNPNAVNRSSGACGLGQQLPCGKWAGAWNDPVAALVAMTGYVNSRYGGWAGAVAFWNANHWY